MRSSTTTGVDTNSGARISGLRVDMQRLLRSIEELAAISRLEDGSCCRLALTDADRIGRDKVVGWMRDAGLAVRIDRVGNIIGLRTGREDLDPIMTGSHIDTVATGGRLDGVLGVTAGLEAIRTLEEAGYVTRRPLAVSVFTNEEGVRFQPDMMGSLVFAGGLSVEEAHAARAEDGTMLVDELKRIGYAGEAPCGEPRPHAYVELHIEQGPVLDREGGVLGAVVDLQGISWRQVTIRGVSNHAGTTPMNLRHDAAYGASSIATFVRSLANRIGRSQVGTVGRLRLAPNLVNVIAREASLSVDLRNTDDQLLLAAEQELDSYIGRLAQAEGLKIDVESLVRTRPVQFAQSIVRIIEEVAASLGQVARRMTSGAGHDAQMIARIAPAAMIFVPSIGGISHNPREDTRIEHLNIGANALLHTLVRLADA